jgi:hypothetical protein
VKNLIIILLLIPYTLPAQANAYEALIGFKEKTYQPFAYEYSLCPWQSFRLITNYTFQIDLICDTEALNVLQQEPDLFVRALEEVYRSHPQGWEHIELIKRWETSPGKYKIHVPGLVAPYEKYFRKMRPTDPDVLDITKQGYAGWYYKPHSCGFGLAVKKLGEDEWQVSGAMFLRAIIPN